MRVYMHARICALYAHVYVDVNVKSHQPSGRWWSNDVFLSSSKTPLPFGEGDPPPPLPVFFFGGGPDASEGPFSPKIAPRGPPMLQDGLQDASR